MMTKQEKDALRDKIIEALKPIHDPEIMIGIIDLGLVYDIAIADNGNVRIKMTLTTPACPYGEMLIGQAHRAAEKVEGVRKVEIALVWDPIWDPKTMCTDLAKDQLGLW